MPMRLRARALAIHAVLAVLVAVAGLAPAYAQSAADVAAVEVVRAEYNDLLDQFYRPLTPGDLLQGGWTALADDMRQHSLPTPPPLGPLPADREAAFAAFSQALR